MYFEQFYLTCLSHASYMLGSEGIAAVVDPQRDVEIYLQEAAKHGFAIQYVIETHLHADFVSGHQELAQRTGAKIYLGAKAGATFEHIPIYDGDQLTFGKCNLKFLETPGHTIESVSVVVTDLEKAAGPLAVLTGDTLFIGDVGRPDLSGDMTPQQLAGMLYDSLHGKLLKLPDDVQVFPAHGAGSLCGRQMSSEKSSTIGKEKATNYALRPGSRSEFVKLLTAELPERPGYFALDVEINRAGAPPLQELPPLPALPPKEVMARQQAGAIILDTRSPSDFGAAHIPRSIQIGLAGQYASWAAIVLGLDQEIVLVSEDRQKAAEARLRLTRVGIENVTGYVEDGIAGWSRAGLPIEQTSQVSVKQLHDLTLENPNSVQVLDVRRASEWQGGHVEHARHKPLDHLASTLEDLDKSKPVAVYCKGGYRSAIAASLLQRAGFEQVMNVTGGFDAWSACHLPVVANEPTVAAT
ncbi:MAG TPA: MBL fold metallo-hydrolase [Bryobacteraceae bacterium]|jgi:rhodanese-related sulfurtransferase/glyoxylase-like metal-dependent hydrolase (beta-lactamase superfamily II)|nr:MBL fold metallo-hydrolase [Bryobacteraceae bacterium]